MSIFSLVKGGKEHGVFERRMFGGEVLNSYDDNVRGISNEIGKKSSKAVCNYRSFMA